MTNHYSYPFSKTPAQKLFSAKALRTFILAALLLMAGMSNTHAGNFYVSTNGGSNIAGAAWNTTSACGAGGTVVPSTSADVVTISCSGKTITMAASSTWGTLAISNGTLSIPGGFTLTVSSLAMTGGTLIVAGTLQVGNATTGGFSITAGTFTSTSGTVSLTGTTQALSCNQSFNNLVIAGSGVKTMGSAITVLSGLSETGTGTLNLGSFLLTLGSGSSGSGITSAATPKFLTSTASSSLSLGGGGYTLTLSSSFTNTSPITLAALTMQTSGYATLALGTSMNLTVSGALAWNGGKLSIGANTLTLQGAITGMSTIGGQITGGSSSNLAWSGSGAGTIFMDLTTTTVGGTNTIATLTNTNTTNPLIIGNNLRIGSTLTEASSSSKLQISNAASSATINFDGNTLPAGGAGGFVGNATYASLEIDGSGTLTGAINFYTTTSLSQLTMNRSSSGVATTGTALTVSTLTLEQGLLTLGASTSDNLIIASGGTVNGNTPTASNMVVTSSSSGYFERVISATGTNYVFPIGEVVGTTEYSGPINLNFSVGTGQTVGFRVVDGNPPGTPGTNYGSDYISRYWNAIGSSLPGSYTYSMTLPYNSSTGDVNGSVANMSDAYYNGSSWTTVGGTGNVSGGNITFTNVTNLTAPIGSGSNDFGALDYAPCTAPPVPYAIEDTLVNAANTTLGGYLYTEGTTSLTGFVIFAQDASAGNNTPSPVNGTSYGVGNTSLSGYTCIYNTHPGSLPGYTGYGSYLRYPWGYSGSYLTSGKPYWLWAFSYDSSGSTCLINYAGFGGVGAAGAQGTSFPNIATITPPSVDYCASSSQTATVTIPNYTGAFYSAYGFPPANGEPNQYNLIWNSAAITAGLVNQPSNAACGSHFINFDTYNSNGEPATFNITIPSGLAAGTYTGYIDPYNSTTGLDNCSYNGGGTSNDPSFTLTVGSAPLSGNVDVGTGGPYTNTTFTSLTGTSGLFAYINKYGLSGNLTVNVHTNTTETNADSLKAWSYACGTTGPYTVTIEPDASVSSPIAASGTGTQVLTIAGATAGVIFDGRPGGSGSVLWTIQNSSSSNTTNANVVKVTSASSNVTFQYITLTGPTMTSNSSTSGAVVYVYSQSATESNITFNHCTFNNGSYGLYYNGYFSSPYDANITISNNTFLGQYYNSAYLYYIKGLQFFNNNIVMNSTSSTSYGSVYVTSCQGDGSTYFNNIYNNSIKSATNGLYITSTPYVNVYYNTIWTTNSSTSYYPFNFSPSTAPNNIENNIFSNTGGGYALDISSTSNITTMDYNDYYSSGPDIGYLSGTIGRMASWKYNSGKDVHSGGVNPHLILDVDNVVKVNTTLTVFPWFNSSSKTYYHPFAGMGHAPGGSGISVVTPGGTVYITSDIYGSVSRSSTIPYIGAVENTGLTTHPALGYTMNNSSSPLHLTVSGTASATNYSTIYDAVEDLNFYGIDGASPVYIDITAGTYTDQVSVGSINNIGSSNNVTINSVTGTAHDVIIQNNANSNANTDQYTVELCGANNVIIKSLTLTALNSSYADVVLIDGASNHDKVTYCTVNGKANVAYPVYVTSTANNNYLEISHDSINNGSNAIYVNGNTTTKALGNVISYNVISDANTSGLNDGIVINYQDGAVLDSNIINTKMTSQFTGISASNCANAMIFKKNQVYAPSAYGYGIYLQSCAGTSSNNCQLSNNMVMLGISGTTTSNVNGVYLSSCSYVDIYYNTIRIYTTYTSNSYNTPLYASSNTNMDIRNNIFDNQSSATVAVAEFFSSTSQVTTLDFNSLYSGGSFLGSWGGTSPANNTIGAWRTTTGKEGSSVNINPVFSNVTGTYQANDLHLVITTPDPSLKAGTPAINSVVPDDINGTTRNGTTPVIGAHEMSFTTITANFSGTPRNICSGGTVTFTDMSTGNAAISWSWVVTPLNGGSSTFVGGTSSSSQNPQIQFTGVGAYTISLTVDDGNGPNTQTLAGYISVSLGGTYTIGGSSPDYATFSAAVSDLNAYGVCGPVIFNARTGTYSESFTITAIAGSSGTNTVTFEAETGTNTDVVLTTSSSSATAALSAAQYVTFQNMSIANTQSAGGPAIQLQNGASHNTLTNLVLTSSDQTLNSGTVSLNAATASNTGIIIQNCSIGANGSSYPLNGICAYATAPYVNSSIQVLSNNIFNFEPASNIASGVSVSGTGVNTDYGDTWTISANSFYSSVTQSNNSYVYPVYLNSGSGSTPNTIQNNYIGGTAVNAGGSYWVTTSTSSSSPGTPAFAGIYVNAGAASITGNTISNIQMNNSANNGDLDGIFTSGSGNYTITGNTIGSASTSNSIDYVSGGNGTMMAGISNTSSGTITIGTAASGNTIANMTDAATGNYAVAVGIYSGNGTNSIVNNAIYNISSACSNNNSANNSIGLPGSAAGIFMTDGLGANQFIENNTIYNINNSLTSANATSVSGIVSSIPPASNYVSINSNLIYGLAAPNGNTSIIIKGILLYGSSPAGTISDTLYNNIIDLGYRTDASAITSSAYIGGIVDSLSGSSSFTLKLYHNSVYLGGTGVASGAENTYDFVRDNTNSSPKDILNLRNNIFVNNRSNGSGSGKHYSLSIESTLQLSSSTEDWNDYYGNGTGYVLAQIAGTDDASPSAIQSTSGNGAFDTHSLTSDPLLTNPTSIPPDFHLQSGSPSDATGATALLTYDYYGTARSTATPTDLGAVAYYVSNSITTSNVSSSYCAGDAITVNFTSTGTYTGGNVYTAQLSDASGAFGGSPTTIGTLTSTGTGSLSINASPGTLPSNATTSSLYKVRVVAGSPSTTGTITSAFTINATPATPTVNAANSCGSSVLSTTATGGTLLWTGGATTTSITVTNTNTYSVTITATGGCSATGSGSGSPYSSPTASASKTDVTCYGGSNGTATSTSTGGTTPYTYAWSGGLTTSSISATIAGTYTLTVTDAHSCTSSASVTINQPAAVSVPVVSSPICDGATAVSGTSGEADGSTITVYDNGGSIGTTTVGSHSWTLNGLSGLSDGHAITATATTGSCTSGTSSSVTVASCGSFTFTVKFFIQGYYLQGGTTMSPLMKLLNLNTSATDVDTATIELRNPSDTSLAASFTGILQTNGNLVCTFASGESGNPYFIVIKHRNSVETWSASTVTMTSSGTYDFSTGAGQAYNSNEVNVGGGVFAIYSGDITRHGAITGADKTALQSALSTWQIGVYNINDITGDGFVDEDDLRIMENNIPLTVTAQRHPHL